MAAPNGPCCAHNQNGTAIDWFERLPPTKTSKTAPSPTTTLGAPAGNLPWYAKLSMSGPAPSPSASSSSRAWGGNRVQAQKPIQISPAWPRAKKRRNSNCQIACVDRHGAGQDGQDGQENVARRHRPPSAARPPPPPSAPCSFRRLCMEGGNEMRRTVLVPSFGKMSCSCPPSSALAAANQRP